MINIIVQRGFGDKQGPDISDPLLTDTIVAISRGTKEIDQATSIYAETLRTTFRKGVALGQLVEVHDALQGVSWRGKIVSISHVRKGVTLWTDLDIERPIDG